jgi:uncharacterized membrane protein
MFLNKKSFIRPGSNNRENLAFSILVVLFFAGILFHLIPATHNLVLLLTDGFLLLTNAVVLYFVFRDNFSSRLLIWGTLTFVLTFLLEYFGVQTGLIFGQYHYGDTMLMQLGNVPFIIALNWMILILATYSIVWKIVRNPFLTPFLSSLLIVLFDIILEPVAIHLDYWQWIGGEIPIRNYIAWYLISLVFAGALSLLNIKVESKILKRYFFLQMAFFLLLLGSWTIFS